MAITVTETTVKVSGSVRVATVPSEGDPKKPHKVLLSCDCPGFRYRGYCRHLSEGAAQLRFSR